MAVEDFEAVLSYYEQLGIDREFANDCQMPWCSEPEELVDTEPDYYGRPQQLIPKALDAWTRMKEAAQSDGITLHLISAFRDYAYQFELLKRKLDAGQDLADILRVNAAPGFSEHHTGRAIDIGTIECPALEEEFELTPAFRWLQSNAEKFGFSMSYPRGNPLGISYEPWHWCFSE